jgi:outer membrane receptor for ferrienterochelin and colicins
MLRRHCARRFSFLVSVGLLTTCATLSQAQIPPASAASAAAAGAPAASASAAQQQQLAPVEITGARSNDTQERRQSTSAKIVVGREEIDRFGDSTLGDVLKRLPGITTQGAPGRGGAIRMRGLGSGYTQILLDGERVPRGFSIESLTPEQVERIEILRAPTAETGAQAIAGTINIVTREGFRKSLNNLRVGTGYENGQWQPSLSWTRNDTIDDLIYNFSVSLFQNERQSESSTTTVREEAAVISRTQELSESLDKRSGLHATGRLQWRGEKGTSAVLMPMVVYSKTDNASSSRQTFTATPPDPTASAPYDRSEGSTQGEYGMLRLNGQWNQQIEGAGRLELKGGLSQGRWSGRTLRLLTKDDGSPTTGNIDDTNTSRGNTATLGSKYIAVLANDHSIVAGAEAENNRSRETHTQPNESGDDFSASSLRLAAYAQDEWSVTPQWAMHLGLRWEGIRTDSDAVQADGTSVADVTNRSSVWTPLFHTVWKPDPKSRDQLRLSLTRSYRAPTLQSLIARPRESSNNSETQPDRAGNPDLKPELATGVDLAFERYLAGSGILSANVFYRQITDYMRSVTALDPVTGRWVSRMQNVGDAVTQGLELEAKLRLSDVVADAPPVDLRVNGSLFRSRVSEVPGPDNRIDQQPDGTINLGADYRFRGTPITLGGNLNWTPSYTTRVSEAQALEQGAKTVGDAYVLYFLNPSTQLRLTASNFAPRDYLTGSSYQSIDARESSQTTATSYINWQLRVELKL